MAAVLFVTSKEKGFEMLILTRKRGEDILIGDHIVVRVLRIEGNKIGLGIDAPRDVNIVRREIAAEARKVARDESV